MDDKVSAAIKQYEEDQKRFAETVGRMIMGTSKVDPETVQINDRPPAQVEVASQLNDEGMYRNPDRDGEPRVHAMNNVHTHTTVTCPGCWSSIREKEDRIGISINGKPQYFHSRRCAKRYPLHRTGY